MEFKEYDKATRCHNSGRKGIYDPIFVGFVKTGMDIARVEFDAEDARIYGGGVAKWHECQDAEERKKIMSNLIATINSRIKSTWLDLIPEMARSGVKMRYKSENRWPVLPHCYRAGSSLIIEYVQPTERQLEEYRGYYDAK